MKNSQKYHFPDFTLSHYNEILLEAKKNHAFTKFPNFDKSSNFVLNRHDVDFDVNNAYELAKLESENKVYSTFFLMLHCEFYNFFEKETLDLVKKIKCLGHDIGLHFDSQFYNVNNDNDLNQRIEFEANLMEYYLETKIEVFSFHNPTNYTMNCKEWQYGGLINTYADYFQSNVNYCSDSNGYWRFHRMIDFIKENKENKIQLLTHPMWWTEKIMSPKEKINTCIESRATQNKLFYVNGLKDFQRENIDW